MRWGIVVVAVLVSACSSSPTATTTSITTTSPTTSSLSTSSPSPPSQSATQPCGRRPPGTATYAHVVWIWMENHTAEQVLDGGDAPFTADLASKCGSTRHDMAVGSPSLPNYIGATSGSTADIHDDAAPADHPVDADNLFRQVRASGRTERSYEEAMSANCALASAGRYAVKHNPAAYYASPDDRTACQQDDVPIGDDTTGALAADIDRGSLPAFAFITPDLCNDTHDCPVSVGDAFLQRWMTRLVSGPDYRRGDTAIFIAWDEPTPMPLVVVSPTTAADVPPTESFDHFGMLRTTEELLGLPFLGDAANAASLREPFGL